MTEENPNLKRVNELVNKGIEAGGLHKLSDKEVEELFLKTLDTISYVGDAAPLILAELTSRRTKTSNRIAMGVSFLALLVSLYAVYQSREDGSAQDRRTAEQLEALHAINSSLGSGLVELQKLNSKPPKKNKAKTP